MATMRSLPGNQTKEQVLSFSYMSKSFIFYMSNPVYNKIPFYVRVGQARVPNAVERRESSSGSPLVLGFSSPPYSCCFLAANISK